VSTVNCKLAFFIFTFRRHALRALRRTCGQGADQDQMADLGSESLCGSAWFGSVWVGLGWDSGFWVGCAGWGIARVGACVGVGWDFPTERECLPGPPLIIRTVDQGVNFLGLINVLAFFSSWLRFSLSSHALLPQLFVHTREGRGCD
jgi:hypothetical protein